MKAKAFDKKFEAGGDISQALDLSQAKRTRHEQRRINVDFPKWMIERLDKEAGRLGVTRQAIIKIWLSERLEQSASSQALHGMR